MANLLTLEVLWLTSSLSYGLLFTVLEGPLKAVDVDPVRVLVNLRLHMPISLIQRNKVAVGSF